MADHPALALPGPPGPIRALLRAEGLGELLVLVALYARLDASWYLFAALFFAPDLGFLGYLAGPRVGAVAYNALHVVLGPVLLAALAVLAGWPAGLSLATIWAAHVAFDRAMGYGLKFASGFRDTHLGRIGKGA